MIWRRDYDNHKEEIPYFAENSFLEDYDEDNLRIALKMPPPSVLPTPYAAVVLIESYFEHEDFSYLRL